MFNLTELILSSGYIALFLTLFAETGLLLGFFLPGDTLLFAAGMLASKNILNIYLLLFISFIAVILGDSFGYYLGKKVGKKIFENNHFFDSYLNPKNLEKSKKFFKKHGTKSIFFARYIPIIRTITPTLAGTVEMHYTSFLIYNILGGLSWVFSVVLLGFVLGNLIPNSMEIITSLIILIVLVSIVLPPILHRGSRKNKNN